MYLHGNITNWRQGWPERMILRLLEIGLSRDEMKDSTGGVVTTFGPR